MFSSIESLRSSFGDQPNLGSVAFVLDTQALYVHTTSTGCEIVSARNTDYMQQNLYITILFSSIQIPGPPGPEVRTVVLAFAGII